MKKISQIASIYYNSRVHFVNIPDMTRYRDLTAAVALPRPKCQIPNKFKNQRLKVKMTNQNARILTFALLLCTFIFIFCISEGFVCSLDFGIWNLAVGIATPRLVTARNDSPFCRCEAGKASRSNLLGLLRIEVAALSPSPSPLR
jgi:hypothetical protein